MNQQTAADKLYEEFGICSKSHWIRRYGRSAQSLREMEECLVECDWCERSFDKEQFMHEGVTDDLGRETIACGQCLEGLYARREDSARADALRFKMETGEWPEAMFDTEAWRDVVLGYQPME